MIRIRILTLGMLLLAGKVANCQDVSTTFSQLVNGIRSGGNNKVPVLLLRPENAAQVLDLSGSLVRDTVPQLRNKMYFLIGKVGLQSQSLSERQHAVVLLTSSTWDSEVAHVATLWTTLSQFRKEDFNSQSMDSLRSAFRKQRPHFDKLLKLIGYVGLIDLKESIRPLAYPPSSPRDRWAATLALARMDDVEATQYILLRTQKQKVDDNVVYEIFPDLVYTRQRVLLDYLVTVLNSDEKNCASPNADNEQPMPCGYRIMEQLAPAVIHYPIALDKSGDLNTSDYAKALIDVRQWFKQNGTSYQISKDKF